RTGPRLSFLLLTLEEGPPLDRSSRDRARRARDRRGPDTGPWVADQAAAISGLVLTSQAPFVTRAKQVLYWRTRRRFTNGARFSQLAPYRLHIALVLLVRRRFPNARRRRSRGDCHACGGKTGHGTSAGSFAGGYFAG